ncbi:hypothetical protein AB838_09830 [Rhodobacteraceae bacterium (ex Bugula neritina AB1)]|nr:hypothetical protein AB838_09830 [Rhodobacteraceae bacterium (ex Bugula neritina AB1)]
MVAQEEVPVMGAEVTSVAAWMGVSGGGFAGVEVMACFEADLYLGFFRCQRSQPQRGRAGISFAAAGQRKVQLFAARSMRE